jgi:fatty-acyl-CoA synthase
VAGPAPTRQSPAHLVGPPLPPPDPPTLPERLAKAATSARGLVVVGSAASSVPRLGCDDRRAQANQPRGAGSETLDDTPRYSTSWAEIHDAARRVAGVLQARGAGPGERVALLATTSVSLLVAIEATWLAGAAVVVLPLPMRLASIEAFVEATKARLDSASPRILLVGDDLATVADPALLGVPFESLEALVSSSLEEHGPKLDEPLLHADDLAILQFTSGSTADPKGVVITHGMLAAQIDAATSAARFDPEADTMASWLPLYHDMGLVGFTAVPMSTGTSLVAAGPQDFTGDPLRWLIWMSAWEATVSAGPNFAYALATRALARAGRLDLSSWRIALNGGEPVDPEAVERFVDAAKPFGFDPGAAFAAFGMAEATLAVSFPAPGSGLAEDLVRRAELEGAHQAVPAAPGDDARRLARLGRPIPGMELRIVEPESGRPRSEREVGELELRGACITTGYWRHPEATANALRDGWLRTGDLAYVADGELVVCGRIKDLIIVGGRNIYPEDIERAAAQVPGVRAGNVIAFGVRGRKGREAVVVVAETREADRRSLRRQVAERVRASVGLPVEDVVLVDPGVLPKTSSGKLQRGLCRERYLRSSVERP